MQRKRRRKPGQGSVRKRANGTWEARITIARKTRSYYGRTRAEALAQINKSPRELQRWDFPRTPEGLLAYAASRGITPWKWRQVGLRADFLPDDFDADQFNALIDEVVTRTDE